ncbi:MurR/RpiR family transcriptional regulator [Clostridium beijerinckii]|uniref:MurR/RpiR family transcriptional regulator n=1 Tax=Clostridium beijerinckii TaxID=1520 RepID=UPI001F4C44A0|nr:MurR/RpiR family transcriptional regulator [Clostridium beijerinckii]NSA89064.1 DNA-binding MurR/RpiR family transcriptional regulator [Clostridium beijerinckii]
MEVSVRLKIKSLYNGLSTKEQNIADYILENPISVAHNSISYLSDELNVADSTLFQFAKKLGYSGFKEFKMAILIEENNFSTTSIHEKIEIDDNELTMAQKVFDSNIKTLTNTKKILGLDDLKKAAEIISNSNLLYFLVSADQEYLQKMHIINFYVPQLMSVIVLIIIYSLWKHLY